MLLSKLRTSGFKKYSVNIHGCLLDNPCLSPINHARMIVKGNVPRRYSVHLKQQGLSSAAGKRLNGIINKPDRWDGFWTRTVTALGQAKQGLSATDSSDHVTKAGSGKKQPYWSCRLILTDRLLLRWCVY